MKTLTLAFMLAFAAIVIPAFGQTAPATGTGSAGLGNSQFNQPKPVPYKPVARVKPTAYKIATPQQMGNKKASPPTVAPKKQ